MIKRTNVANTKSRDPKNIAITAVTASTIMVSLVACWRFGQLTLRNSPRVSFKYSTNLVVILGLASAASLLTRTSKSLALQNALVIALYNRSLTIQDTVSSAF